MSRATPASARDLLGTPERSSLSVAVPVPPELVEAVAVRVVELLADRLPADRGGYLDADGAAAYLARPKSRVYELVAAGRLAHYRDGRSLLFRPGDLDAALRHVGTET